MGSQIDVAVVQGSVRRRKNPADKKRIMEKGKNSDKKTDKKEKTTKKRRAKKPETLPVFLLYI